jgi:hypothetical protein
MNNLSILIPSCDNFKDTWKPFFHLFNKYWDDNPYDIYLTTDKEKFRLDDINIVSTQINPENKPISWSLSVIKSLNRIPTKYVLLIFDDFFFTKKVNTSIVNNALQFISSNNDVGSINLSALGPKDCYSEVYDDYFLLVKQLSKYKTSCRPAIWEKEYLLNLLSESENAWEFEIYGTIRSFSHNKLHFRIDMIENDPIKIFDGTGIVKGRWHTGIPAFFSLHNINVDYSIRGFFKVSSRLENKFETLKKLISDPLKLLYYLVLLKPRALLLFKRNLIIKKKISN